MRSTLRLPLARLILTPLLTLCACGGPVEAPAALQDLSSYFYARWPDEDPAALEAGVANLYAFTEQVDLAAKPDDRSFVVNPFTRDVVAELVEHDRDPADTVGVGILFASAFPPVDHLAHLTLADGTPVEPSSPDRYDRTIIEGDVDCFVAETCPVLRTEAQVERKYLSITVLYTLRKELRWALTEDGERALLARSWNVDSASGGENFWILQGYSIDLFLPYDQGALRYQVSWQETEIGGLDDEDMTGALSDGMQGVFDAQEEWLTEGGG